MYSYKQTVRDQNQIDDLYPIEVHAVTHTRGDKLAHAWKVFDLSTGYALDSVFEDYSEAESMARSIKQNGKQGHTGQDAFANNITCTNSDQATARPPAFAQRGTV